MHFRHTISGAHVAPSSSKSPKRLLFSLAVQAMKTIDATSIPRGYKLFRLTFLLMMLNHFII